MFKKVVIIIGLLLLFAWGIYHNNFSSKETNNTLEKVQPVSNKSEFQGIEVGNRAPDFELATLDGEEIRLSDMKGKKIILNLFATWCPPCKAEMPDMQEFYQSKKESNVEILAVNLTSSEKDANAVKPFVQKYGLTFPVLLDVDGIIGNTYQAFTIPTSYIIDSKGIIQKRIVGPMDKNKMMELINNID